MKALDNVVTFNVTFPIAREHIKPIDIGLKSEAFPALLGQKKALIPAVTRTRA
jgi:hypothetical protein